MRSRFELFIASRYLRARRKEAVISVITYGELMYGVEKSRFREQATQQLMELAGLLPVMELPLQAGQFYDMRAHTLENQSHDVVQSAVEMHGSMSISAQTLCPRLHSRGWDPQW